MAGLIGLFRIIERLNNAQVMHVYNLSIILSGGFYS